MSEDSSRVTESTTTAATAPFPVQDRLRFAQFVLERLPNGRCRAKVELTWRDSERFSGESEGLASQAGDRPDQCRTHHRIIVHDQYLAHRTRRFLSVAVRSCARGP